MRKAIDDFDAESCNEVKPIEPGTVDANFNFEPPLDGIVLRVHSKVLDGYTEAKNTSQAAFQNSVGQDNLWIQKSEKEALIKAVTDNGEIPDSIAWRVARFHLIDNTRGEPPRWTRAQVKSLKMQVNDGCLTGSVSLVTKDANRGYDCELFGYIEVNDGQVTRFDMVAEGKFWGEGRFTRRAPKGKFPLAITFQLADRSTAASHAVPHGGKGWIEGYYEAETQ